MSAPAFGQDAALSAASFLASIGAESSTAFGSDASTSAANSAPSLPISAKVSLIDAQIDSLEVRIEQSVSANADKLRERAASNRTVDHDLNQLWRSINQTSSRIVTVGPQLAPLASEYHSALAQTSKQGLLISVLSDLLTATRQLEALEKLQQQSGWSTLTAQLPEAVKSLQAFSSSAELQNLPAVAELRARFDRLHHQPTQTTSKARTAEATQSAPTSQAQAISEGSTKEPEGATNSSETQTLSLASKVLETARAIIVSRGPEEGWKEVRIELDAPAPPPPAISAPIPPPKAGNVDSSRTSLDTHPEHFLRDQLIPASVSLSRNSSSSSSAANARSRHKPKLGARVIRPQDQLGSGPFNAQDTPLDADGWGLDEDDEEIADLSPVMGSGAAAAPSQATPHASPATHRSVSALVHDERSHSPSSSGTMQRSISSSSSQRSAFAVQDETLHGTTSKSDEVDAWALGEEDNDVQADAWDLDEGDAKDEMPSSSKKEPAVASKFAPKGHARHESSTDAWGLREEEDAEEDEDPWGTQAPHQQDISITEAVFVPSTSRGPHDGTPAAAAKAHEEATAVHRDASRGEISIRPAHSRAIVAAASTSTPTPSTPQQVEPDTFAKKVASPPKSVEMATEPASIGKEEVSAPESAEAREAPAPALVDEDVEEEAEGDAWGFEESSSASEGDRAEFTPMAPLQEPEAPVRPAAVSTLESTPQRASARTGAVQASPSSRSAEATPKKVVTSKARQSKPSGSPPSPTGWADNFSDDDSPSTPAGSQRQQRGNGSSTRSISASSRAPIGSPARGSPARRPAKLPDPIPAAVAKEECTISRRSLDLVELAEGTLDSVLSKLQAGRSSGVEADNDDVEALAGTIFKIFEMHRALMPVAHGEALRDVPSLAMQFFNDCEYLARELSRLVADKGDRIATAWTSYEAEGAKRWSTKELAKLEQEAASTRGLGQRWFEAQMTAQSKILLDTLMEADGFARTFDDQRFARCERCIKQVVQTLQQLAKAWRPVLVASRFHAAIGRLVDLVFQKVLHDVLDLEDIGESESEKIASLVKTLGSLEVLFSVNGSEQQSAAPLWVPSWFKTSYLIEILTGSLVDIEFLAFEAGALVDYSRKELTGLIKALFADTSNRSKLLRRIESAPVEVLAH
ncbi:RZZ complex, subunit Zw10 [Kalmanozyma brasiliensis GHG001]|uniref:RZZ complex, subunit Zw10 n=1 Tax=Kalmanozyma brasiliensis (strain GHG001) TaxID=1365824 RepID=UPI0028683730|nr:RZZ complex, subunit Zw10 [Kalmanozyma brasiliensis GHG001]EST07189.2 RZZ complex, subunit Zw10 [Kalmanozyma brasiliensis GHG001]